MWLESVPDEEDPLRQGDLLVDVVVPDPRVPTPLIAIDKETATTIPAIRCNAIVVSQCCDNVDREYVAVAPVRQLKRPSESYLDALLSKEPTWDDTGVHSYIINRFHVEPVGDELQDQRPRRYWVAHLDRSVPLHGDCDLLGANRRARMDLESRRDLRNNLGLLWSRPEEDDAIELKRRGIPVGLTKPF